MGRARRLFLAVHPSREVRDRLAALREELAARSDAVRLVAPHNLHLTLHFLGDTDEELLTALEAGMHRALESAATCKATAVGGGCFPSARNPRVFWAGVSEPTGTLAEMHRRLARELEALEFETDSRPFSPHITIGYARKKAPRGTLREAATTLIEATQAVLGTEGMSFTVGGVSLVESVLGRGGPTYTDLLRVELPEVASG
ncbi:MAG: RNA 2',3'-cyclic phosphodiesterase [Spirochaetaceae bacterium]